LPDPLETLLEKKGALQRTLLSWYARNKRDLPWRKNQDPYRILISEFMLQQTRVETVIPYFDRFLKLFPTLVKLAHASSPKILKAWEGLGYYARARHLHAAAKMIMKEYGGKIPQMKNALLSLPGFGPYVAGAVASIAFNEPVAAVDGNIKRILIRLSDIREAGKMRPRVLEEIAGALVPAGRASDFNQALMDLGAMVCLPGQPRCASCPVKKFCAAQGSGHPARTAKRVKVRKENWAVALIAHQGQYFLYAKEGKGLLSGLWQFPYVVGPSEQKKSAKEKEQLKEALAAMFGLDILVGKALPVQDYFFTHIHAVMKPYLCFLAEGKSVKLPKQARWIKPSSFSRYPLSTAMKKIAVLIPPPSAGKNTS
jgi:A/G-specific adenine glycosylase